MAGDWIKMRTDLAEDPAVIDMAALLGDVDEDLVVGKLHRLWSWADRQSRDGHATGVTETWIDRYVRCTGFAKAMCSVNWLVIEAKAIRFPNFDRHNGETAKTRALGTKRKKRQRASVPDSVPKSVSNVSRSERDESETREEKRREEKEQKQNPLSPPASAGGKPRRSRKREKITFAAFIDACHAAGEKPIRADDPLFQFAEDAGIPREFIALRWWAFARQHRESGKMQKDWRAHFRDCIRGNWQGFWFLREGQNAELTTVGIAAKRERDAERERQRTEEDRAA